MYRMISRMSVRIKSRAGMAQKFVILIFGLYVILSCLTQNEIINGFPVSVFIQAIKFVLIPLVTHLVFNFFGRKKLSLNSGYADLMLIYAAAMFCNCLTMLVNHIVYIVLGYELLTGYLVIFVRLIIDISEFYCLIQTFVKKYKGSSKFAGAVFGVFLLYSILKKL